MDDPQLRTDREDEHLLRQLERLFVWAKSTRGAMVVGDVLAMKPLLLPLPESESALWSDLASSRLPGPDSESPTLASSLIRWLANIDPVHLSVYLKRIAIRNPPTLSAIAKDLGRTRERIRQIQKSADAKLAGRLLDPEFDHLRWVIADVPNRLGSAFPFTELDRVPEIRAFQDAFVVAQQALNFDHNVAGDQVSADAAAGLVMRFAGNYEVSADWLVKGTNSIDGFKAPLLAKVRQHKFLPRAMVIQDLLNHGLNEFAADYFLTTCPQLRLMENNVFWWDGDVAAKSFAILLRLGRPATAEELLGLLGIPRSIRSLRGALYRHPEIVRISKKEFALKQWGRRSYLGISDEIALAISERGGSVQCDDLIKELSQRFDVVENSVLQYAIAPRFVIRDGWIRLREQTELYEIPNPRPLTEAGIFSPTLHEWVVALSVNDEMLRGSGRPFSRPLGWVMSVIPGTEIEFEFGDGISVPISWPVNVVSPQIGSMRIIAEKLGARIGDRLLVRLDAERRVGSAMVVRDHTDLGRVLAMLAASNDDEPLDRIAAAIAVKRDEVLNELRKRGDEWLASLVDSGG